VFSIKVEKMLHSESSASDPSCTLNAALGSELSASREAGSLVLRKDVQPLTLPTLRYKRLSDLSSSELHSWLASSHGPVGPSGDQVVVGDGSPPPVNVQPGTQMVQGERVSHTDSQLEGLLVNQLATGRGGRQGIADPHASSAANRPPDGAPNEDGAQLSSTKHPTFTDGANAKPVSQPRHISFTDGANAEPVSQPCHLTFTDGAQRGA